MTLSPHPSLEDRYFQRMASALGDKARILPWVVPGHVVDIGAGGGELAGLLAELPGVRVTATDIAPESLARLRADGRFEVVERLSGADADPLTSRPASTVVANAVLHEVHSYSPDRHEAVLRALRQIHANLVPGGRLIIRDGVMPDDPDAPARFRAPDDDLVRAYLELSPHPELSLDHRDGWWIGTRHRVSEGLCTVTWGRESLPREALERYELWTVDGCAEALREAGFALLHADAVTQPGYVDALGAFRIEAAADGGWTEWFPPTNALWVAERI